MAQCIQCGKQLRLFEQVLGFAWGQNCRPCHLEQQKLLEQIQTVFNTLMSNGDFSQEEWNGLVAMGAQKCLSIQDIQKYLYSNAINHFQYIVSSIDEQGALEEGDDQYLQFLRTALAFHDRDIAPQIACLERVKRLDAIKKGQFHPIEVDEILDVDEEAYYKVTVTYLSSAKRKTNPTEPEPGELLITNKFLYFKRPGARGMPIKWRSILDAPLITENCIRLDTSGTSGAGYYTLDDCDPEVVQAYILAFIKQAKHHLPPKLTLREKQKQHVQIPGDSRSQYDSPLEKVFLACWRYPELPLVHQYRIQTAETAYKVDFAHLETKSIIEIDGLAGHGTAESLARDHHRQRTLEALGWRFRRYGGLEVRNDPMHCVRDARSFLLQRMKEKGIYT